MASEDFCGRGLAYPLTVTPSGLAETAGVARVEQSIRTILGTEYGERAMRPRFGCNLKSLAFAPNNITTANLARYFVSEGLAQWEPRVDVLGVDVVNDAAAGCLVITIRYRLRATRDVHNLVYPFYLEQAS